jgi:hypothetical protein
MPKRRYTVSALIPHPWPHMPPYEVYVTVRCKETPHWGGEEEALPLSASDALEFRLYYLENGCVAGGEKLHNFAIKPYR